MKCELPTAVRDYLAEALFELARAKTKVVFHPEAGIGDARGWYGPGEFHVCMRAPLKDWLAVFVHEFQHFRQHREYARVWKETLDTSWLGPGHADVDCNTLFEEIYQDGLHPEINEVQRCEIVRRVLECERDCWIRTAQEVQLYRLPIDLGGLLEDAFLDCASYAVAFHHGRWLELVHSPNEVPHDLNIDFFDWTASPLNQKHWKTR